MGPYSGKYIISLAVIESNTVPYQPIASLLIIYRVSRGADYFSREENVTNNIRLSGVPPSHSLNNTSNLGSESVVFVTPSSS